MNIDELRQKIGIISDEMLNLTNEQYRVERRLDRLGMEREGLMQEYEQRLTLIEYYRVMNELNTIEAETKCKETHAQYLHKFELRHKVYELRRQLILS